MSSSAQLRKDPNVVDNRYKPQYRPAEYARMGSKHAHNAQLPFVNAQSEHSPALDEKSTHLIEGNRSLEQQAFEKRVHDTNQRRAQARYDFLRRVQMRETLEHNIGTPHSESHIKNTAAQMIATPSNADFSHPRGNWDIEKELKQTGAEIEMAQREFPPCKSLAHIDLFYKVQGDLKAEAMIRRRFEEDHALQNWRRSYVEARRDLIRENFRRRREQNRALEQQAQQWCNNSLLPVFAGQDGASQLRARKSTSTAPQWKQSRKTKKQQERFEKEQKERQLQEWRARQEAQPGREIGKMINTALTRTGLHDKHDSLAAKYGVPTNVALVTHHQRQQSLETQCMQSRKHSELLDGTADRMYHSGGREMAESLIRRERSMLPMSASTGSLLRTYSRDGMTMVDGSNPSSPLAVGFASARRGPESAANSPVNNSKRSNFSALNYDGEFVPHTRFCSAGNKNEKTWRSYNTTPLPALGSNNLDAVPTTGSESNKVLSFTAVNPNHTGAFNFDQVEEQCQLPLGELAYPQEFQGLSLR